MTDNETIKALEYCVTHKDTCENCPCVIHQTKCATNDPQIALGLINRQQAEIEAHKRDFNTMKNCANYWNNKYETAKAEATEQLSKKIESRLANNTDISNEQYQSIIFDISEACKEMVGDAK